MKATLFFVLILGHVLTPSQCDGDVRLRVIRQEKYNGCGSDFIGADMRVIYRLLNKSDHAIYVFGLSSDELFDPTGYVVRFDPKTQKWLYPTGDNKPIPWKDRSILDKSAKIIEPGKSIEFDACHSTRETKVIFARIVASTTYLMATNQAKYVQTGIFLANKASGGYAAVAPERASQVCW